jgi:putative phosphoribosyl transferase
MRYKNLENSPFIDDVVCLSTPINFRAVGQFYRNFDQVDDAEVKTFLNESTVNSN